MDIIESLRWWSTRESSTGPHSCCQTCGDLARDGEELCSECGGVLIDPEIDSEYGLEHRY